MEAILLMVADGQNGVWPWNALPWVFGAVLLMLGLIDKYEEASAHRFNPPNSHGAAKFTEKNAELKKAGLLTGEGVPIGYAPDGKTALHYSGFGHLLCVAAARTGKGATLLINALLSWRHSVIVIDPKAENALVTAKSRKRFGRVHILNPFKIFFDELGGMQARFNPMAIISSASASFHADCDKLAAALVWEEYGSEGRHWTTAARILVSGVIAALIRHEVPEKRNLVEVARVISSRSDTDGLFAFCEQALKYSTDPFIKQKLGRFALPQGNKPGREMEDVISTAITQLGFIGNAAIAESLSGSSFRFSDAKTKPGTTVFITLPLDMLDVTDTGIRVYALCAPLFYSVVSFSAHAETQTLEQAWTQAYRNNPSLEAERAALRATDEQVSQALSHWRPSIDATGSAGKTSQYAPDLAPFEKPNFTDTTRSYGVQVTQPLFRGFRTRSETEAAEKQVLSERAKLASAEQQLFLDTASAYLGTLRDEAALDLERNHETVLEDKLKETRVRSKAGELTGTDVRQAESRLARARVSRFQAESTLTQDRAAYLRLVGDEPGQLQPPALALESPRKLAGAHDFILELPQGYDTRVGEHGSNLSGGQRQRIAIARALIMNPRILIFDEATSALDYESERIIQENMQWIVHGRTVLIIAHRLTAVRNCNQIITIERGRLVESGSHEDLLRSGGRYASLWRLQGGRQ